MYIMLKSPKENVLQMKPCYDRMVYRIMQRTIDGKAALNN